MASQGTSVMVLGIDTIVGIDKIVGTITLYLFIQSSTIVCHFKITFSANAGALKSQNSNHKTEFNDSLYESLCEKETFLLKKIAARLLTQLPIRANA